MAPSRRKQKAQSKKEDILPEWINESQQVKETISNTQSHEYTKLPWCRISIYHKSNTKSCKSMLFEQGTVLECKNHTCLGRMHIVKEINYVRLVPLLSMEMEVVCKLIHLWQQASRLKVKIMKPHSL